MLSNNNLSKEASTLTKWLVSIPSVAHAKGPALICQAIYDGLLEFPYFKKNKDNLHLIEHQQAGKSSVIALVKAMEEVSQTIVLLCDTDTASPYHYGMLKGYSTNCDELLNRLKEMDDLNDDRVKEGIANDDILLGLGVLQSKCATGSMLVALKELSDNYVRLNVNVLFICTSESAIQHRGIKKCIPFIQELIEKENLTLRLAINAKPNFPLYRKDQDLHIFTGNYGKIEPSFYIIGNSAASFKPYSGFSASIIASELIRELELNAKLTQKLHNSPLVPTFDSLRVKEFGKEYSPDGMQISFSMPIVNLDLNDLLEILKEAAAKAIENASELVDQREAMYAHINKEDFTPQVQDAEVVSFSDLLERASHNFTGNLHKALHGMIQKCRSEGLSLHQASITIIERLNELAKLPRPSVVVYFTDNFLPPQGLSASVSQDRELFMILDDLLNRFNKLSPIAPTLATYYAPTDACLLRPINLYKSLNTLRLECPVNVEDIEGLNVPTITLGVKGDNLTLLTEYVEKSMFEYLPSLVVSIVDALGENPVGAFLKAHQDLQLQLEQLAQKAESISEAVVNESREISEEQQGEGFYSKLSQGTLEPQSLEHFLKQQQAINNGEIPPKLTKKQAPVASLQSPDKFAQKQNKAPDAILNTASVLHDKAQSEEEISASIDKQLAEQDIVKQAEQNPNDSAEPVIESHIDRVLEVVKSDNEPQSNNLESQDNDDTDSSDIFNAIAQSINEDAKLNNELRAQDSALVPEQSKVEVSAVINEEESKLRQIKSLFKRDHEAEDKSSLADQNSNHSNSKLKQEPTLDTIDPSIAELDSKKSSLEQDLALKIKVPQTNEHLPEPNLSVDLDNAPKSSLDNVHLETQDAPQSLSDTQDQETKVQEEPAPSTTEQAQDSDNSAPIEHIEALHDSINEKTSQSISHIESHEEQAEPDNSKVQFIDSFEPKLVKTNNVDNLDKSTVNESAQLDQANALNETDHNSANSPFAIVSSFFKSFKRNKAQENIENSAHSSNMKTPLGVEYDLDWLQTPELAHQEHSLIADNEPAHTIKLENSNLPQSKPDQANYQDLEIKDQEKTDEYKLPESKKHDIGVSSDQVADLLVSSIKDKLHSNALASLDEPKDYQQNDLPLNNNVYATNIALDEVEITKEKLTQGSINTFNNVVIDQDINKQTKDEPDTKQEPEVQAVEVEPVDKLETNQEPEVQAVEVEPVAELDTKQEPEVQAVEVEPVAELDTKQEPEIQAVEVEPISKEETNQEPELQAVEVEPVAELDTKQEPEIQAVEVEPVDKLETNQEPEVQAVEVEPVAELDTKQEPEIQAVEVEPISKEETNQEPEVQAVEVEPVAELDTKQEPELQAVEVEPIAKEETNQEPEVQAVEVEPIAELDIKQDPEAQAVEAEPVDKEETKQEPEVQDVEAEPVAELDTKQEPEVQAVEVAPIAKEETKQDPEVQDVEIEPVAELDTKQEPEVQAVEVAPIAKEETKDELAKENKRSTYEEKKLSRLEELTIRLAAMRSGENEQALKDKLNKQQQDLHSSTEESKIPAKIDKVTLPSDLDLTKAIDSNVTMLSKKPFFISEDPHNTRDPEEVFAEAEAEAAAKRAEAQERLKNLSKALAQEPAHSEPQEPKKQDNKPDLEALNQLIENAKAQEAAKNKTKTLNKDSDISKSKTEPEESNNDLKTESNDTKVINEVAKTNEQPETQVEPQNANKSDTLEHVDEKQETQVESHDDIKSERLEHDNKVDTQNNSFDKLSHGYDSDDSIFAEPVMAMNFEDDNEFELNIATEEALAPEIKQFNDESIPTIIEVQAEDVPHSKTRKAVDYDVVTDVEVTEVISPAPVKANAQIKEAQIVTTESQNKRTLKKAKVAPKHKIDNLEVEPLDEATRKEISSLRKVGTEEAIAELLYANEDFSDEADNINYQDNSNESHNDSLSDRRAALRRAMYGDDPQSSESAKKETKTQRGSYVNLDDYIRPSYTPSNFNNNPPEDEANLTPTRVVGTATTFPSEPPKADSIKHSSYTQGKMESVASSAGVRILRTPNSDLRKAQRDKRTAPTFSTAIQGKRENLNSDNKQAPTFSTAIVGKREPVEQGSKDAPVHSTAIVGKLESHEKERNEAPAHSIGIVGKLESHEKEHKEAPQFSTAIIGKLESHNKEHNEAPAHSIGIVGKLESHDKEHKEAPQFSTAIVGKLESHNKELQEAPAHSIGIVGKLESHDKEPNEAPKFSTGIVGKLESHTKELQEAPAHSIGIVGKLDSHEQDRKEAPKFSTAIVGKREAVKEPNEAPKFSTAIADSRKAQVKAEHKADSKKSTTP